MTTVSVHESNRRFPTLNAVRAIGALMVVCTHVAFNTGEVNNGWIGAVLSRLDFGVALFFILSGFLLSRPFLTARARGTPQPSWTHYFWKRAVRILPLYWAIVVAALLLDPANDDATWQDWVSQLTLTQIYRDDLLASSLTQMWSLCTEVAFYLVLPPLCLLLAVGRGDGLDVRRVVIRSGGLGVLAVIWQGALAPADTSDIHYGQWLPGLLPWFLVGMVFAAVSADLAVRPRPHLLDRWAHDLTGCWLLATAIFAIACSDVAGPRLLIPPTGWEAVAKLLLYSGAAAFYVLPLVLGPESDTRARAWLSAPVPSWLGEISYGIFAIHMLMLNMVYLATGIELFTGRFALILALTLASTLVLASASFYLFERPVLRTKNLSWFVRREPSISADPPATSASGSGPAT